MLEKQLYINNLSNSSWQDTLHNFEFDTKAVTVWRIAIPDLTEDLEALKSLLQPKELEKAIRYQQENDRQSRIISKAILRILLGRYTKTDSKDIRFSAGQNKKPCLENFFSNDLHFNVSHSGNWILIAIANTSVGIDIEQMNASFSYQNMLSFSFNLQEISYIKQSEVPYQSFYKLWTRKECLLKATGQGLTDELSQIPSLDGIYQKPTIIQTAENWQITSFKVDENHVGSVAFNPIKTVLQFFNFQL